MVSDIRDETVENNQVGSSYISRVDRCSIYRRQYSRRRPVSCEGRQKRRRQGEAKATDPRNTAGLVYRQQVVGKSGLWIRKCWPVSRICVDLDPDPDKRWLYCKQLKCRIRKGIWNQARDSGQKLSEKADPEQPVSNPHTNLIPFQKERERD
jgi:hypothetical protein